jgi:hypothetical protein
MDKYDSWYKLFSSRDVLLKCCRWWWRYRWLAKWRCGNYMLPSGNDNSLRFWVYMCSLKFHFFLIEDKLLHVCVCARASNIICKLLSISWWHETIMRTHVRARLLLVCSASHWVSVDGMKQSQVAFVREHKDLKEILVAVKIIFDNCATELLQLH